MKDIDKAIENLRDRYISAVQGRNSKALTQLYDSRVRIFDAWGVFEYSGADAWQIAVEGWLSSNPTEKLQVNFTDCVNSGNMDLATMTAMVTYAGLSPEGQELHAMQNRITWIVKTIGHNLRIVHEHTSAPVGFEDMKAILKRKT